VDDQPHGGGGPRVGAGAGSLVVSLNKSMRHKHVFFFFPMGFFFLDSRTLSVVL
jgi:hypothetical protein